MKDTTLSARTKMDFRLCVFSVYGVLNSLPLKNAPPAKRGKFSGGCAGSAYEAFDIDSAASCLKLKDGAEFCGKDVFKSDVSTAAGTVSKSEAPSDDVR